MKKYIVAFLILTHSTVFAQQKAQFTQYIMNQYLLNPALSGMENYTDLKLSHRKQWQGIKDAPQTSFVTINMPLGDEYLWANPLTQFYGADGDPMSRSYMQNYTSSPAHHGIGATFLSDQAGPLRNLEVNATYAYHLQLSNAFNLSVGVSAGISKTTLNANDLDFGTGFIDPALAGINNKVTRPNVSVGTWLYGARFFAGVSVDQFAGGKLILTQNSSVSLSNTKPNIFLTTGYKFSIDEEIAFLPSILYKNINGTINTYDINGKIILKDRIWFGASYRKNDSFAGYAGFNISKLINLSYAYDTTTSALNQIGKGSHEVSIGILLNNLYEVPSFIRW
jgi:type IX secretion system PorP/SprF family membrane protein